MLGNDDAYASISIRQKKLNGVKLEAKKHKRSDMKQLEFYLDKLGIKDLTDEQYEQLSKHLKLEEEVVAK